MKDLMTKDLTMKDLMMKDLTMKDLTKVKKVTMMKVKKVTIMKVKILALLNVVMMTKKAGVMITVWTAKMAGIMKVVMKIYVLSHAWNAKHVICMVKMTMMKVKITEMNYHNHLLTKYLEMMNVGVIVKMLVVWNSKTFKMKVDLGLVTLIL